MAKKTSKPAGERPAIDPELIDELLKHGHGPEDVKSVLQQITKAVVERALQGEMTEHLGYGKHEAEGRNSGNSRNGVTKKRLKGDFGAIDLETPRDRNGEFEPRLVKKNQTRFSGFDDKILSMYARGMSTRDIQAHIQEMYGIEISPTLVSDITDGVMEDARAWQSRPLEPFYAIVFLDALF
jgi:putative transposase